MFGKVASMMKLEDYPEFKAAADKLKALEGEEREIKIHKGSIEESARTTDLRAAAALRDDWREDYAKLERRQSVLCREIGEAKRHLNVIVGQASLEICKRDLRPKIIEHTRRVLQGLRMICEGNLELTRCRDELISKGVETGSIPPTVFTMGASWDDPYGGRIVDYRKHIAAALPELKKETE